MHAYHELKEMLCDELEEIVKKGNLSASNLDIVDKLTHSIKSIVTIMAMDEGDYSNDGNSGYSGRRSRTTGRYYDGEGSNDSGYSVRRYSRGGDRSEMMHKLEVLADEASSQEEREVIRNAISKMKNL